LQRNKKPLSRGFLLRAIWVCGVERLPWAKGQDQVSRLRGCAEETLMKQWTISYLDKDGVQQSRTLDAEQRPSEEEVARRLRPILFPVADELDLNDLEGRTSDPTVKSLRDQNSVQILSITEAN